MSLAEQLFSAETDRLEELVVNPIVLEITRRRGEIDIGGSASS